MRLLAATRDDFDWLHLDGAQRNGLRTPPGGAELPFVLDILRAIYDRLAAADVSGSWLMLAGDEIVGLIGLRRPPSIDGEVEIGYGVATARRRRGHATAAVALLLGELSSLGVRCVFAETAVDNPASQRVLERNGFAHVGRRVDPEDGEVIGWRRKLPSATFASGSGSR